ncbi:hypothetical protein [Pedobacter sp.]|uniref:hypothetical protein n=1 Tax=Pedobacter sp. TaxID=1411316 RepID=UPI003BABFEB8
MNKNTAIDNLYRVALNMFSQFRTDEPLISDEAKEILSVVENRNEISKKIINNRKNGEIVLKVDGEDIKFFVEA